jgi:formyltetrahydrofolate synthetase
MAKYDNITVQLTGKDGNAFGIIATVQKALKNNGVPPEEISQYRTEAMSADYDNLLSVTMDWVDVQ